MLRIAPCNAIFIFVDLLLIPFLELKPLDVALAVVGGQNLWTGGRELVFWWLERWWDVRDQPGMLLMGGKWS